MQKTILYTIVFALSLVSQAFCQLVEDVADAAFSTNQIHQIRFEGLQYVDEGSVRSRIHLEAGQSLSPATLSTKVKASVTSLYESGLFDDVTAWYDYSAERLDQLDVVFRVKELPALDSFDIQGNDEIAVEDLDMLIQLIPGRVYNKSQLERDRQSLLAHYRSEGFLLAEVAVRETQVDESSRHVSFVIDEGEKVVVQSIAVKGNSIVPEEDITESMASQVDAWYGGGEFKEEIFEADRDSVLLACRSHGLLDAALTQYEAVYLPDSTFRFYSGRLVKEEQGMPLLLSQLNEAQNQESHVIHILAQKGAAHAKHLYRWKKNVTPTVALPAVTTEEQAVILLNRIVMDAELRQMWIDHLPTQEWKNVQIDSLLNLKKRTRFEERQLTRYTLEETFPALASWDDNHTSSKIQVQIAVNEGRRYYAGSMQFVNNEVINDKILERLMSLDSGDIFDYRLYLNSKKNVMDLYREDGYLFSRIEEQRNFRDSIVDVTFNLIEGLPALVRLVNISGNTRTKDKVIRREIKLFPGDTYRQSLMERSFREIMQLNYFDNIVPDIQPVEGSEQDVDLAFSVVEREAGTGTFSAGMAYSQADGLVGTIGVSIPNCCMGDGQSASLNVEYGADRKNYTLGFSEPWFMDKPITLGGSLNYTWVAGDYEDDDILRYGFTGYTGSRLHWPDDYFSAQLKYSFQVYDQGDNVDNSLILNSGIGSSLGFTVVRDDKDLPMFPTEGSRFVLDVTGTGLGGDFRYIKTDLTLKWWFPLFRLAQESLSLGITNEYGFIVGDAIPYSTLYQMGGVLGYDGLLRGYSSGTVGYRRLGRSYQFFSMELVYPIAPNRFYLLPLFFDAGNVFGERYSPSKHVSTDQPLPWSEWDPSSLKRDFGFGFRVIVPMLGIIGFDFAWPLDKGEDYTGYESTSIGDMQFNFLIGQGF